MVELFPGGGGGGPNVDFYRNPYSVIFRKGGGGPDSPISLWIRTWSHRRITLPHYMCELSILLPWICRNGILCSIFLLLSGILLDIDNLSVHKEYLPVYFKEYCYPPPPPPPFKHASTIHGYFVRATPLNHSVVVDSMFNVPPSLVLALL